MKEKIFQANRPKQHAGVIILVSDEITSNQNKSQEIGEKLEDDMEKQINQTNKQKPKKSLCFVNGKNCREDTPVLNVCASYTRFIKKMLLQLK